MTLILSGTDGLSDVDGTAAAPAIRGTDTNTGIFFPAADTIGFSEGGAEAMRIDSSGNVGIGTSSPVSKLHVSGGVNTYQRITNTTDSVSLDILAGSGICLIGAATNHPLLLGTNDTERMRIDTSGYVTINSSTSLNAVFSVYGKSNIAPCALQVNANGDYGYVFKNASGTLVGAIGINASTTSYNTSSDYRLKENIAPMTGALAKVSQLKPVTYDWKSGGSSQGFIAHELQAVVPDCVTGEKDAVDADGNPKYQGIDTSFLVATLTAAIQEQQALITALTTRITALEAA
jgi:hypothetical protein